MDFTMNDESGILIEGFELAADDPPALAPALLPAAYRGGRAEKAKDLLSWELDIGDSG